MKPCLSIIIFVLLIAYGGNVALAQGGDRYPPNVDPNDVYRIARTMYCDVCAGVPLADCPSGQCQAWREEIADLVSQGRSDDEIRQHFADRYGDKISGVPLDATSRRITYAVPLILTCLAALGIGWQVYRWRGRESRALQVARAAGTHSAYDRPVPDNVDPEYLERVLAALEQQ